MTPLWHLMLERLTLAQEQRSRSESFWTNFELIAMHSAVNEQRAIRGLDPVPIKAIEDVERLALGHTDYARRFSRSCSLLAEGSEQDPE